MTYTTLLLLNLNIGDGGTRSVGAKNIVEDKVGVGKGQYRGPSIREKPAQVPIGIYLKFENFE